MKKLLTATAILEGMTGILLLILPNLTASLLLGAELLSPIALTIARITGAAITSLAIACWLIRDGSMVKVMLFYNFAVGSILIYGKLALGLEGMGLLPAIIAHFSLLIWGIIVLQKPKAL
jgi:hypothetical protein